MERYQITLAYDGTDFLGFQRQGAGRTVQAEVEAALSQLGWQGRALLGAGRTDSGVHAFGQVIAFDLDWKHGPEALGRALNAHLPRDVAVRAVNVAAADFHPRSDARLRSYRYQIYCEPERDPLRERYAWRVWPAVDVELLHAAAQLLPGVRDYAAFGSPPRPGGNTVRVIYRAGWRAQASGLLFEVSANAFLYHMVRRLVFIQVLTGQRQWSLEALESGVCEAQPQAPGLAPPQGLVLSEVRYTLSAEEQQMLDNAMGKWNSLSASGEDDCGKDLRH